MRRSPFSAVAPAPGISNFLISLALVGAGGCSATASSTPESVTRPDGSAASDSGTPSGPIGLGIDASFDANDVDAVTDPQIDGSPTVETGSDASEGASVDAPSDVNASVASP